MSGIWTGIVRALLAMVAGAMGSSDSDIASAVHSLAGSIVSGDPNAIGAALLTFAIILWSVYEKKRKEK